MNEWIKTMLMNYGYFAVFFLIFIENVFPPIPSEVILLLGGFMTTYMELNPILMIVASTLGSLAGAILLYYIGKKLGLLGVEKVLNGKIGKTIRLTNEDFLRAHSWFNTKGEIAVFLCRFVPLLRSLISIPAGIAQMEMKKFTILTVIGSLIWNTIFIYLGRYAGAGWEYYSTKMDAISKYVVIVLGVIFVIAAAIFYFKKKKKAEQNN